MIRSPPQICHLQLVRQPGGYKIDWKTYKFFRKHLSGEVKFRDTPEGPENYSDVHSPLLPLVFVSRRERGAGGIPQETKTWFTALREAKPFL